jgi:hypothetical protein
MRRGLFSGAVVCLVVSAILVLVLLRTTSHSILPKVYAQGEDVNLAGTWNLTLKFPECSSTCPCPGGVPNIPIPALHTYVRDGSFVEVPGGTLFRGPGLGSWKRMADDHFVAHFKFFIFNTSGGRAGSEEVTSHITLTDHDTFEAAATFDLFDPAGNMRAHGCNINETATRFGFGPV